MTAQASPSKATRPWRLRAYTGTSTDKKQRPAHEEICRGDAALNVAFHRYDRDPAYPRVTVEQQW